MTQPDGPQRITIEQAMDLAGDHHRAGRLREAETIYRQVLGVQPQHPDALHQLGLIAMEAGQLQLSLDLIRRAITLNPAEPNYHSNLGRGLSEIGQHQDAIAECRTALQLQAEFPEALNNLGNALLALGQLDEALEAFRSAVALRPEFAHAWSNLGIALQKQGRIDQAIAAYHHAAAIEPRLAVAYSNLGNLLRLQGQLDQAIATLQHAVQLNPNYAIAHTNLGSAMHAAGRSDEAIAAFERSIAIKPSFALAHYNLGMALILKGDFERGWKEHEWRIQADPKIGRSLRGRSEPQWDGADPSGKRILVYAEQGLGDTIHFARYLPMLAQRGARVILQCHRSLLRLMKTVEGIEQLIAEDDPLPEFDVHSPLLSLPLRLGTMLQTIPATVPYVGADSSDVQRWRDRLRDSAAPYRVGLAWAGNPNHENDRNRSVGLSALAPLAELPRVALVSLQKRPKDASAELQRMRVQDFGAELVDFADTAALIQNLDLVISVDTAVAHLAGAMGASVWTLLPHVPDWRWLLGRDDSPWYPTMRLFRQPRAGDWETPVRQIHELLKHV